MPSEIITSDAYSNRLIPTGIHQLTKAALSSNFILLIKCGRATQINLNLIKKSHNKDNTMNNCQSVGVNTL